MIDIMLSKVRIRDAVRQKDVRALERYTLMFLAEVESYQTDLQLAADVARARDILSEVEANTRRREEGAPYFAIVA